MARFYAEIQGNRGAASRMGDAGSGMSGHIRGWNVGAEVQMVANGWASSDGDTARIHATRGSAGYSREFLGEVEQGPNGTLVFKPSRALRDAILKAEGKRPVDDAPSSAILGA